MRSQLVIDSRDDDVAVERGGAVPDVVVRVGAGALTVRERVVLQRRQRNRIDPILRDDVAGKRLSRRRIVDGDRLPGGGTQVREVSRPVQLRRHAGDDGVARELPRPLPRHEEERLLPLHGPAERSPELIQVDRCLRRRKEVPGVQRIVASRFERAAPKRARARSRRHRDDAAGRVTVFRGVVVRDDAELLHRIDGKARQLLRPRQPDRIRRVAAVQDEALVARPATRDEEHRIVLRSAAAGVDHDDARRERHQRRRGAVRERQCGHHFAGDDLRDYGALRVQRGRGRLHLDQLRLRLDVERDVGGNGAAHFEHDSRSDRRREPNERDLHAIRAGHEGADPIHALLVADRLEGHAGVLIGHLDPGGRDRRAGDVFHDARECARAALA